jgi:hypothetical protein
LHGADDVGIGGEVRADGVAHLAVVQQLAQPQARLAKVVADDRQVAHVGVRQRGQQMDWGADQPEAADHHRRAAGYQLAHMLEGICLFGGMVGSHWHWRL